MARDYVSDGRGTLERWLDWNDPNTDGQGVSRAQIVAMIPGPAAAGAFSVTDAKSATGTTTQVASAAADTPILAANAGRVGGTVFNDDANTLDLRLAPGAATTSNYTVKVFPFSYYELPFGYTGIVRGIWEAAGGGGGAKITEFTV
jgi:hypothetical protein